MKIGLRLNLGFLAVALLVLVVGYVGLNATNRIVKQYDISDASKSLFISIMGVRETLHDYLLTEDLTELSKIQEKHQRYEEFSEMWLEALGHGSDSAEFRSKDAYKTWVKYGYEAKGVSVEQLPQRNQQVSEEMGEIFEDMHKYFHAAMDLHLEELEAKARFDEGYLKEKEKRHGIKDIAYKIKNPTFHIDLADFLYKSKEALFQYRDKKHLDEWLESIKTLKTDIAIADGLSPEELSALSTSIDEYYTIAQTLSELTIDIRQKEADGLAKLALVDKHIAEMDEKIDELDLSVTTSMEETKTKATIIFISIAGFSIILALTIALFTSRSISKPVTKLRDSAVEIAKGNLDIDVKITSNDEIGQLASAFNEMAGKLKESYAGLEEQVRERTKELVNVSKKLKEEIMGRKQAEEMLQKAFDELEDRVEKRTRELTNANKQLATEIAERKQAEEALQRTQKELETIMDSVPAMIFYKDRKNVILRVNETYAKTIGISKEYIEGKSNFDLTQNRELAEKYWRDDKEVMASGIPKRSIIEPLITDETRWFQTDKIPYRDDKGNIQGVIGFSIDITSRVHAEEALRESEENFRALADNANDGIAIASGEGTYVYVNKRFAEITGYSISELLKTGFKELIHPDELMKIKERYKRRLEGKYAPRSYETTIIRKDRKELPVEVTGAKTIWRGQPAVMVIARDIIKRKQAEQQIMASLKEKEVLLKEIHHRVKNNLQIISSLLDMRIMRTDNQEVIDLFEDMRTKIQTMALIHSQLYRSERFDKINMGTHIQELIAYLSKIYAKRDVLITPIVECSDVYLSINQAIPCGLVINELLSNAFKHAFKEGQKGTIEISLNRQDHNEVFLKVKDNGIGIPKEIDILKTDSLGFKLMRNTVQHQLKGTIHIESGAGTTIIVRFKILEEEVNHV